MEKEAQPEQPQPEQPQRRPNADPIAMFKVFATLFNIVANSVIYDCDEENDDNNEDDSDDIARASTVRTYTDLCAYVRSITNVDKLALTIEECERLINVLAAFVNPMEKQIRAVFVSLIARAFMSCPASKCTRFIYFVARQFGIDVYYLMTAYLPLLASVTRKRIAQRMPPAAVGKWYVYTLPYFMREPAPVQEHSFDDSLMKGALTILTDSELRLSIGGFGPKEKTAAAIELVLIMSIEEVASRALYLLRPLRYLQTVIWPSDQMLKQYALSFTSTTAAQIDVLFEIFQNDLDLEKLTSLFVHCSKQVKFIVRYYVYMIVNSINYPLSGRKLAPSIGLFNLLPEYEHMRADDNEKLCAKWLLNGSNNEALFIQLIVIKFPELAKFYIPHDKLETIDRASSDWYCLVKFFDVQCSSIHADKSAEAVAAVEISVMRFPFVRADLEQDPAASFIRVRTIVLHTLDLLTATTLQMTVLGTIICKVVEILDNVLFENMTEVESGIREAAENNAREAAERARLANQFQTVDPRNEVPRNEVPGNDVDAREKIKLEMVEKIGKWQLLPTLYLTELKRAIINCIEQVDRSQVNLLHAIVDIFEHHSGDFAATSPRSFAAASMIDAADII